MPLGAHMSISGGVEKAISRGQSIGCETIQIFTKNANQWQAKPLDEDSVRRFQTAHLESKIDPVIAHTSYLINLASPDDELWEKSCKSLLVEIERCSALRIPYLVLHPGAHLGAGEDAGLNRITSALNEALGSTKESGVMVLLETTAGQGSSLCYSFEHLAHLLDNSFYPERLGICFDTCHVFAAGYDIRTPEAFNQTIEKLDRAVGLKLLKAIHINDSRGKLGSRRDRHEHIGMGEIGLEAFRFLMNDPRLKEIPMVLETPKGPDMKEDIENMARLRGLILS